MAMARSEQITEEEKLGWLQFQKGDAQYIGFEN